MSPYPATSGPSTQYVVLLALLLLLLAGCNLVTGTLDVMQLQDVPVPTVTSPAPDASAVMAGICFASAQDAAGRLFVLRSAAELENLFDLADNSQLCRQPVQRHGFDFAGGRVLAGLWSATRGCTAQHQVVQWQRDDDARRITLQLRLHSAGDCDYELVRPYWLALDAANDYEITFEVLP